MDTFPLTRPAITLRARPIAPIHSVVWTASPRRTVANRASFKPIWGEPFHRIEVRCANLFFHQSNILTRDTEMGGCVLDATFAWRPRPGGQPRARVRGVPCTSGAPRRVQVLDINGIFIVNVRFLWLLSGCWRKHRAVHSNASRALVPRDGEDTKLCCHVPVALIMFVI